MTSKEATARLKGRRIVKVEMNAFRDGRRGRNSYAHDPIIYLDDGTQIGFVTEETEVGVYGVDLIIIPKQQS